MVNRITSRANSRIILVSSLAKKKYRDENRLFLLEGKKLTEEAVKTSAPLYGIFCTEDMLDYCEKLNPRCDIYAVSGEVFDKISTEKSPEGIISVSGYLDSLHRLNGSGNLSGITPDESIFVLAGVRDPGNVGTIVRTAAAMGINRLIMSRDCADIYSPRAVRASMGNLFRQKIMYVDSLSDTLNELQKMGYSTYAAVLDADSTPIDRIGSNRKNIFIVGNEGHGIDGQTVASAGKTVFIPMEEGVESLNVSSASTVFMWHMRGAAD